DLTVQPLEDVSLSGIDLAVTKLPISAPKDPPRHKHGMGETFLGEEVYCVGFPLAFSNEDFGLNQGFPFPFVARGCISGFDQRKDAKNRSLGLFISGQIDHGYSGGPVVLARNNGIDGWVVG